MLWYDSKKDKKNIKKESYENWKTENTRKSNNVNKCIYFCFLSIETFIFSFEKVNWKNLVSNIVV